MNASLAIPLVSGLLSIVIGVIGALLVVAFNRKIIYTTGIERLPSTPEGWHYVANKCSFLGRWNRFDTYITFVFIFGLVFLFSAVAVNIAHFDVGMKQFERRLQLGFLINAIGWIIVSIVLFFGRFIQLMYVFKYKSEETFKGIDGVIDTGFSVVKHSKAGWSIIIIATIGFLVLGLVFISFDLFILFYISGGAYILFMTFFNYRKKR